MPLDQIVLAIDTPWLPGCLVLALVSDIMLQQMSTALTIPCIFVNGDTDPWVRFRTGAMADGYSFSLGNAVRVIGVVAVAVARHLLADTLFRFANTSDGHVGYVSVLCTHDIAHQPGSTSLAWQRSVDQIIPGVLGQ